MKIHVIKPIKNEKKLPKAKQIKDDLGLGFVIKSNKVEKKRWRKTNNRVNVIKNKANQSINEPTSPGKEEITQSRDELRWSKPSKTDEDINVCNGIHPLGHEHKKRRRTRRSLRVIPSFYQTWLSVSSLSSLALFSPLRERHTIRVTHTDTEKTIKTKKKTKSERKRKRFLAMNGTWERMN